MPGEQWLLHPPLFEPTEEKKRIHLVFFIFQYKYLSTVSGSLQPEVGIIFIMKVSYYL